MDAQIDGSKAHQWIDQLIGDGWTSICRSMDWWLGVVHALPKRIPLHISWWDLYNIKTSWIAMIQWKEYLACPLYKQPIQQDNRNNQWRVLELHPSITKSTKDMTKRYPFTHFVWFKVYICRYICFFSIIIYSLFNLPLRQYYAMW